MSAHKNPAKILVIEDNPADVVLLRLALDQHGEEYELEVLRDGAEAIQYVHDQRTKAADSEPCVIVMDMHLPKHDGPAVLHAIRHEPSLAHVHVVALTSVAAPKDETEVRRLGVRLYTSKPMDLDDWIQLARDILTICREPSLVNAA